MVRVESGARVAGERPQAELEGGVEEAVERDEAGIGGERGGERGGIEAEFDRRARDVPGDVLAADQVVALAMIERVGFEEAAIRGAEPFPGVEAVVGGDQAGGERVRAFGMVGQGGRRFGAEGFGDVGVRHGDQRG